LSAGKIRMSRIPYEDLIKEPEPAKTRVWLPILVEIVGTALVASLFYKWPLPALTGFSSAVNSNLLTALVLVATGGGILVPTISTLRNAQQERSKFESGTDFIPVMATVKDIWLEEFMGESAKVYQPRMSIEYEAGGRQFKAQMYVTSSQHNFMSIHKRTLRKHAPGTKFQVYVNSHQPDDFQVKKPTRMKANIKLLLALVISLLPCALLGFGLLFCVSAVMRLAG